MLPVRADPTSEEARLLGPFSLRRKSNIHRRFFREELGRTLPPLELRHEADLTTGNEAAGGSNFTAASLPTSVASVGLEYMGVFEELEALARPPVKPMPRRARLREAMRPTHREPTADDPQKTPSGSNGPSPDVASPPLPRPQRRRFGEILAQTPILTPTEKKIRVDDRFPKPMPQGQWAASLSPLALLRSSALGKPASAIVSREDLSWIRRSQERFPATKAKKN